jgi:hypothetical protein
MIYSRERITENHANLTAVQIRTIKSGKKPAGLDDAENVIYDVMMELLER